VQNTQRPSKILTFEDAVIIQKLMMEGGVQHHIAAEFGVNQGRISEIKHGHRHPRSHEEAISRFGLQSSAISGPD